MISLPLHYVDYFTHHLPDCLETLEIAVEFDCFDDWIDKVGESEAFQFAARASRIIISDWSLKKKETK